MMKKRVQHRRKKKKISNIEIILSAILIVAAALLLIRYFNPTHTYYVQRMKEDGTSEEFGSYHTLKEAKQDMIKQTDSKKHVNGVILNEDKKIIAMGYAVVDFRTKECSINTNYTIDNTNTSGYTNGCYGSDAAYIDTSDDGTMIKFKQAGVIGWVSIDDVQLKNYYNNKEVASINYYSVQNKKLTHHITTNISKPTYSNALNIGKISLKDNAYYSYDGHYFYNTFETMIHDYRNDTFKNSINTKPYYNFYQYVPHRMKSSYTADNIDWYIENYLGFNGLPGSNQTYVSLLYKSGNAFIHAQNTYGTNAIMMLSLAMNESDFGRSEIAISKNNLFGHAAYDASPGASASAYKSVNESIQIHAKDYLHNGYLNPFDKQKRFHGGFFGDKAVGMNVKYASDPYWGEKAASHYRTFDVTMGQKDINNKDLILTKSKKVPIYKEANAKSTVLYTIANESYTYLVLDKLKDKNGSTWYKIQSDIALDKQHDVIKNANSYDFRYSYGYLRNEDILDVFK